MPACSRALFNATLRWPVGLALAGWRYLRRSAPIYRVEDERPAIAVPDLRDDGDLQRVEHGTGPLYHRQFTARIRGSTLDPVALLHKIVHDFNAVAPAEVATFSTPGGRDRRPAVGDDLLVELPGPWDGPVRVVHRRPTVMRLATRRGHLEAGQIEFRTGRDRRALRFEIELWIRSGDRAADLLYDKLALSKEAQLHVWVHFCEQVAALARGELADGVRVHTTRQIPPGRAALGSELVVGIPDRSDQPAQPEPVCPDA